MYILILGFFLLLSEGAFVVESKPDSSANVSVYRLYFPVNSTQIEDNYLTNRKEAEAIASILKELDLNQIDSVRIIAYASPEGPLEKNLQLSRERAGAIARYLTNVADNHSTIQVIPGGEAWEPLCERVAADTLLTSIERSRILSLIDNPALDPYTKKWRLKNCLSPELWQELVTRHLPYLRCCEIHISYTPAPLPEEVIPTEDLPENQPVTDTPSATAQLPPVKVPMEEIVIVPLFAAGSNLISDLAISPTLFIEIPIGQWSIWGEYAFPWWLTAGNDRAWQILKWDLGPRYWFRRRKADAPMDGVLTGHYIGLDLGAGYYDIEPKHTGYQGEFQTIGLEYGYAWKVGRNWRMEAFLGLGWMGTHYRYYEGNAGDTKLYYQHNGKFTWWGPTRVGLNLKYVFHRKKEGSR